MSDSEEYVVLEHRVKKSSLMNSNLYSSMLSSITTPLAKTPLSSLSAQEQQQQQLEQRLPAPDCLDDEVILDYLNTVDEERRVKHISKTLKACSLLDDEDYLTYCTDRFLKFYDDCKHILAELNPILLEKVYLRMPKDLLPDDLQESNKFLTGWINKYHSSVNDDCIDSPIFSVDKYTSDFVYHYSLETQDKPCNKYIKVSCVVESMSGGAGGKYRELVWNSETCVRVHESCYEIDSQERVLLTRESKWDDNGHLLSTQHLYKNSCAGVVDENSSATTIIRVIVTITLVIFVTTILAIAII